jgi:lipoprotein-anchoring transpeptidase ErfK/SrfK
VAALTLFAPAVAAADTGKVRPATATGPYADEKLSDEVKLSRVANGYNPDPIRSAPRSDARRVGEIKLVTSDGYASVYLVLGSKIVDDVVWFQIRIPGRPNGRTGWVTEEALSELKVVRTRLVVDRKKLRATLTKNGKKIWSSRIGVGQDGTPTPKGRFWITELMKGDGGVYGPYAFGTSAYSPGLTDWPGGGIIGIHGTNQPGILPGKVSHGCIRVPNDKIRKLKRLMPIGTPLLIR